MSLVIAIRAELIKTKRSAAFWLSLLGAAFIPVITFLMYVIKPGFHYALLEADPWQTHLIKGWQSFSAFLLPMFVILICSLIPQIEYKNNTWKQVFASPQSIGDIFFSKYVSIMAMILFLFVMFTLFMLLAGVSVNLILPRYTFLKHGIEWGVLLKMITRTFISLLAIISIQYWLSLRFRNFIAPIGIGLALLIGAMIGMQWEHIDKFPYAFPFRLFLQMSARQPNNAFLVKHEVLSLLYFVIFTTLGFLDLRFRKERG